jgi:hypothetical protein
MKLKSWSPGRGSRLNLAIELARYRLPLRIIDKAPARTDKSKAVAVWVRSLGTVRPGRHR